MKAILSALSVGLAAAIVVLGMAAPKANAVVIYDWSGLCDSGCTGQAAAVLTLEDTYVPGTQVMGADFISFSYSSSSGSFGIPVDAAFDGFSAASVLPVVSGQAQVLLDIDGPGTLFDSQLGGGWLSLFTPAGIGDGGDEHQWVLRTTDLTAPGPLSLLALGLAGLALAGRRRLATPALSDELESLNGQALRRVGILRITPLSNSPYRVGKHSSMLSA